MHDIRNGLVATAPAVIRRNLRRDQVFCAQLRAETATETAETLGFITADWGAVTKFASLSQSDPRKTILEVHVAFDNAEHAVAELANETNRHP